MNVNAACECDVNTVYRPVRRNDEWSGQGRRRGCDNSRTMTASVDRGNSQETSDLQHGG